MRKRIGIQRDGRKVADAQRVAPCDWSALGARIRQAAMAATAFHLAERAKTQSAVSRSPDENATKD